MNALALRHSLSSRPALHISSSCRRPAGLAGGRLAPPLQQRHLTVPSAAKTNKPAAYTPSSAKDAIETGTRVLKEERNSEEAIRLYNLAMAMNPNDDEARAALYNMGCAYAKQKRWKESADSIKMAINDYKLKLVVALKDDDLASLRDTREWIEALTEMKGGLSREAKLDLRTEAKAPFRLPRLIFFGALFASSALGLIIITTRLIKAFQGGEGAPDVQETVQNFGINTTAVIVLGALLYRDISGKQKALKVTDREESLSRLQIDLGNGRVLPLIKFRGAVRPVIIAGTKAFVEKSIRDAEPYFSALRARGVSVIPVISEGPAPVEGAPKRVKEVDPADKIRALKKELNVKDGSAKGFDATLRKDPIKRMDEVDEAKDEDKKWRLEAYDAEEWAQWVVEQREFAKMSSERLNCYVQVQLDGTVRGSGTGTPPWAKFLDDIPELDSIRTKFTDNIGPSI